MKHCHLLPLRSHLSAQESLNHNPKPDKLHPDKQNSSGLTLMEQGGDHDHKRDMVVVQFHGDGGDFSLLAPEAVRFSGGLFDKPLSCFGCGIGWFSFLLGFAFPPLWYYATVLYFGNYYLKDPRERPGLAASAIAALICSVILLVSLLVVFC